MIIVIEGNIGSGKSVLCKLLCSELAVCGKRIEYVEEPIDLWTNMDGENILQLFYQNKKRWGFTFQVNALFTMLSNSLKAIKLSEDGNIVIMERSVFSSKEVFAQVLSESIFNPVEKVAFNNCKSLFPRDFENYKNKVQIYLKTNPVTCFDRINQRSRSEEIGNVSIDYLNQLHTMYEEKIYTQKDYEEIFVVEGTLYTVKNNEIKEDYFKNFVKQLLNKIKTLS